MSAELVVTDLKQWFYCPRIVFYEKLLPLRPPTSYKMNRGKCREAELERLESRRGLREYGLQDGQRRFRLRLFSKRWQLTGKLDLLIESPDALYPVDFKDTEGPPRENHARQLAGYALILREIDPRPVPRGFIYRVPDGEVFPVELTEELLAEVAASLDAIRTMLGDERFPDPTPVRARCEECEYRNFCGDVF